MRHFHARQIHLTPFPILETSNLHLIEITPNYAPDIFQHFSDSEVTKFLDVNCMTSIDEAKRIIDFLARRHRENQGIRWGIVPKDEGRLIGTCGFNTWAKRRFKAELGYDISSTHWRRGIATEAVQKVIQFGFTVMELQTIEALILPENSASKHFLQSINFCWDKATRDFHVSSGQYKVMDIFSLKKHVWLSQNFVLSQSS